MALDPTQPISERDLLRDALDRIGALEARRYTLPGTTPPNYREIAWQPTSGTHNYPAGTTTFTETPGSVVAIPEGKWLMTGIVDIRLVTGSAGNNSFLYGWSLGGVYQADAKGRIIFGSGGTVGSRFTLPLGTFLLEVPAGQTVRVAGGGLATDATLAAAVEVGATRFSAIYVGDPD